MLLAGRTQPLQQHPIREALRRLRALGFDAVEVCLENPDLAPERLTAELAETVGTAAAGLGFRAVSVSWHRDYVQDDTVFALLRRVIPLVPLFGARVFVITNAWRQPGTADPWPRLVTRTRALARVAEEAGVTLAQEFEPGFVVDSTAALERLFAEVASPALAANLDLGHAFLSDPDPVASIRRLGPRLVHGHVEDMKRGVHAHLLPGEGDMDLPACLAALAASGFAGPLALDLYQHDYEAVAPAALARLRAWLPPRGGHA